MAKPAVRVTVERWPIAGSFVISRGSRTEAVVVVAEISKDGHTGRGECVPYARYDETVESVVAAIESASLPDTDREALRRRMPPGAARNALDSALWDVEAKASGLPASRAAGIGKMSAVTTAYTLSLNSPEGMAKAASAAIAGPPLLGVTRPLLKVKLGGDGDDERIGAIRAALPDARLIADANEAWNERNFARNMQACAAAAVEVIEQPLPAGADDLLLEVSRSVPICADESVHVAADLPALQGRYDAVNVKLDKAGGLTEALDVVGEARRSGLKIMVGCMVGTSLAMAPAMILAQQADFVDLDGPLLLARDRTPGLIYSGNRIEPPNPELWG